MNIYTQEYSGHSDLHREEQAFHTTQTHMAELYGWHIALYTKLQDTSYFNQSLNI